MQDAARRGNPPHARPSRSFRRFGARSVGLESSHDHELIYIYIYLYIYIYYAYMYIYILHVSVNYSKFAH